MNIVIITLSSLPFSSAEGTRLMNFGIILLEIGYKVSFICNNKLNPLEIDKLNEFSFFSNYSLQTRQLRFFNHIKFDKFVCCKLESIMRKGDIDFILCADVWPWTLYNLKKFACNNKIKLIFDSVEWFSPSQFSLGFMSPFFIFKEIEMRKLIDKSILVISISNYLASYFSRRNIKTIRVPVLMDMKNIPCSFSLSQKIRVVYAGSPGKKDYISNIIHGILNLTQYEANFFEFIFFGISVDDVLTFFSRNDGLKICERIEFKGKVERRVVLDTLVNSDFTILVRSPKKRYAKAGFPTKIVESLATGTSVISNLTSDLDMYLNDGENSILIDNEKPYSVTLALRRITTLSHNDIVSLKKKSRVSAEEFFDLTKYVTIIQEFLSNNRF